MKRLDSRGYALSLLRIVAAALFVRHGFQKLFGSPSPRGPRPHVGSLLWIALALGTVGVARILLGLFTRPIAFALRGEMAVHALRAFWTIKNGGELAVLFCFLFLYLCCTGAGPLSDDRLARRKR